MSSKSDSSRKSSSLWKSTHTHKLKSYTKNSNKPSFKVSAVNSLVTLMPLKTQSSGETQRMNEDEENGPGKRHTEDAFFFFPLWPDFDLVFFGLGFFFTSFTVLLLFLTPGPKKNKW